MIFEHSFNNNFGDKFVFLSSYWSKTTHTEREREREKEKG